jgi:hypothetical protein
VEEKKAGRSRVANDAARIDQLQAQQPFWAKILAEPVRTKIGDRGGVATSV